MLSLSKNQIIKALKTIAPGKIVIDQVKWIYPKGLLTTGNIRSYLPFMIADKSGEIPVTTWHKGAVPLFSVIEEGQFIKLIGGRVETKRNRVDGYNVHITVGKRAQVEVCVKPGEICVPDPSIPMKVQVSYFKRPHTCASITLNVKMLVSEGVQCSPTGHKYLHFIGSDETGEISCFIYEPHSANIGHLIKEGIRVQLENVAGKAIKPKYQPYSNHPLEIGVFSEARITILEVSTKTSPLIKTVEATSASSCATVGGFLQRLPHI